MNIRNSMLGDELQMQDLVMRLLRFRERLLRQGRTRDAARVDVAIAEANAEAAPRRHH